MYTVAIGSVDLGERPIMVLAFSWAIEDGVLKLTTAERVIVAAFKHWLYFTYKAP